MEWENEWAMRVARWWAGGFDLFLAPIVWELAATLAEMTPIEGKPWKLTKRISFHSVFTPAFNVTGQPAIS